MTKVALVTGGTRGIGSAIAQRLRDDGFTVAANYAGNSEAAKDFENSTGIATFKWDVGDFEACEAGVAEVVAKLGSVDVLINNAGITRDGMMHKMSMQAWDDVLRVNLSSMFYMTKQVIGGMRDRKYGRVINVSSINSQKGQRGQTNYSAAKAGIIGFTKALAQETARSGITVNAICPGYVDTDMVRGVPEAVLESIIAQIPVGRLGAAEEIAHCTSFLASEASGFITGSTLSANGGQYMS